MGPSRVEILGFQWIGGWGVSLKGSGSFTKALLALGSVGSRVQSSEKKGGEEEGRRENKEKKERHRCTTLSLG